MIKLTNATDIAPSRKPIIREVSNAPIFHLLFVCVLIISLLFVLSAMNKGKYVFPNNLNSIFTGSTKGIWGRGSRVMPLFKKELPLALA